MEQMSQCQNCRKDFQIKAEDSTFYEKVKVPNPTFCPECRLQRRFAWINFRNLFTRKVSDEVLVSMYSEKKNLVIVKDEDWWSDKYEFFDYGKDYDFERSFFEQFRELLGTVPLPHLQRNYPTFENSSYCNAADSLKNCYLTFAADKNENCMYSMWIESSKDCCDALCISSGELCYECVDLRNCYNCQFCQDCENSNGLILCNDCLGCNDCFGCTGLRHKSYYIFNKPYSKEEYEEKMKTLNKGSYSALDQLRKIVKEESLKIPRKFIHERNTANVSGDYIYQSKDVRDSYTVEKAEDCRFCQFLRYTDRSSSDCYDLSTFGIGAELVYESAWCGINTSEVKFSVWCYGCSNVEYSYGCHFSQNLFACVGLKHKQYCIFNKQYSKEEYEETLAKIKKQMKELPYVDKKGNKYSYGEFFPIELSPFDYNQSLANDFTQLSKDESLAQNYGWIDYSEKNIEGSISWKDIPDNVEICDEGICKKAILCRAFDENAEEAQKHNCSKYYKLIPAELSVYKSLKVPLPRYCFNSRHFRRLSSKNPIKLWGRECTKCGIHFESSYSYDRPELVYCESCYQKEIY